MEPIFVFFLFIIVFAVIGNLAWSNYLEKLKDEAETRKAKKDYEEEQERKARQAQRFIVDEEPEEFEYSYNKVEEAPTSYVVFHTETTGFNPQSDYILEIGAIKCIDNEETARFQTYAKPSKPIPAEATAVNGITDTMVSDAPTARAALKEFFEFIGDLPLIAYHSDFDMGFMQFNCERKFGRKIENKVVDALPIARECLPALSDHKLKTIKRYYGMMDVSHSAAMDDCCVINYLYQHCREEFEVKTKYGIFFDYGSRELNEQEQEYLYAVLDICDKLGFKRKDLFLRAYPETLTVHYDFKMLVTIKLTSDLKYVMLNIPYDEFKERYTTEIETAASSKEEGNFTRAFVTDPAQLREFKLYFKSKRKHQWTTETE